MTQRILHLSLDVFKQQYPEQYKEFAKWDDIVSFDVTLRDDIVVDVTPYTAEDEEESRVHEYSKNCNCTDCQEYRLGVRNE